MNSIKSMTGYGKASQSNNQRRITVEIKSLNSKQLDLSTRIASIYRECEFDIRTLAAKSLIRAPLTLLCCFDLG